MKKRYILVFTAIILLLLALIGYWGILSPYISKINVEKKLSKIHDVWKEAQYLQVIELGDEFLIEYPEHTDIALLKAFAQFNFAFFSANSNAQIDKELIWESLHTIRQVLAIDSSHRYRDVAYYILGKCYFMLSKNYMLQSIDYLEKAIYNGYKPDDIYEFLSSALVQINEIDEAISLLTNRIKKKPKLPIYLALIDIYLDKSDIENGIQVYEQAKPLAQTEHEILAIKIREARFLLEDKKIEKSISLLTHIVETFPQSVGAHFYLGNAYEQLGDDSKARYEWRLAYKMSPYWDKVIAKLDSEINY